LFTFLPVPAFPAERVVVLDRIAEVLILHSADLDPKSEHAANLVEWALAFLADRRCVADSGHNRRA
jgi:hypothetical protein